VVALTHDVSLLCRRVCGANQLIITARVETLGAGKAGAPDGGAEAIRGAVAQVLGTPAYGLAAQRRAVLLRMRNWRGERRHCAGDVFVLAR
jgi:hypothetical protein